MPKATNGDVDCLVVGAGISGLATAFRLRQRGLTVTVFDAAQTAGGTIATDRLDGMLFERGPNGFLDSRPDILKLAKDLGLEADLLRADDAAKKRYLLCGGELVPAPSGPPSLISTPLMSWRGKARLVVEGLVPRGQNDSDESLYQFAQRRVGREFANVFLDAMVTGIYAGDIHRLSARSTFPRLVELESEHGSLTRALLHRLRSKRSGDGPAGPSGRLTSFSGGMATIIKALTNHLEGSIVLGRRLRELSLQGEMFRLVFDAPDGPEIAAARSVVLAIPAYAVAKLAGLPQPIREAASRIPYAPIAVAGLSYSRAQISHPLDGFGFLVPAHERCSLLGALFSSTIFPGPEAKSDSVLIRAMLGGMRHPELVENSSELLAKLAHGQLSPILGISGQPAHTAVVKWSRGIPQYHIGHAARLQAIGEGVAAMPGLVITGNAFRGVSVDDCCREAEATAERVRELLS
ncbi:MAG: protoporphyrinogen oxidase [Myxococcales bacterium]|nr:protoporphyrinogen oxidase [Myxococcales bacterium]